MTHECDPKDYMTHAEHAAICEKSYNSIMNWAQQVARDSVSDRKDLREKVGSLEKLPLKVQTWFIVILITCIIAPYIVSKITTNGAKEIKEAQQSVTAIESKQARIEGKMDQMMKKMGIRVEE